MYIQKLPEQVSYELQNFGKAVDLDVKNSKSPTKRNFFYFIINPSLTLVILDLFCLFSKMNKFYLL